MDDHPCALGRVAVLVEVDRDAGDTRDGEVPRRDGMAEAGQVGEGHPAHAGVDMAVDVAFGRQRGDVGDRVDDALRVLGGGPDDQHRVVVDRCGHRIDVGPPVAAHRDPTALDTEVVAPLLERGVGTGGQDDVGRSDPLLAAPPLAGRLHRHQQALGATCGDVARRLCGAFNQSETMPTTSSSRRLRLGNASVLRALSVPKRR